MRILITTHYFYPENFPVINDLAVTLRNQGHQICIGTGKPNYSGGRIYTNYNSYGFQKDTFSEDIIIFRTPIIPRRNNKISLFFNYISFIISGSLLFPFFIRKHKFDFILHYGAGPMSSIIPSIIMKFQKKTHLAIWVQDLWPETLNSYGINKNKFLYKLIRFIVKKIYTYSDTVLVQSKAFVEPVSKYTNKNKIIYYPNSFIDFVGKQTKNKKSLPNYLIETLNNYKCIIFAGNLGEAQSLDTIIRSAELLQNNKSCKILFVGSGSKLDWLILEKEKKKIENIVITGPFSSEQMNEIYSLSFGLLVTLKNEEVFNNTIPSKVQSYLAAGKPIVAALSGEGGRIIKESGSGLVCESEDSVGLAKNITKLLDSDPFQIKTYGEEGRKYFIENYEMEKKSRDLISIINSRVGF